MGRKSGSKFFWVDALINAWDLNRPFEVWVHLDSVICSSSVRQQLALETCDKYLLRLCRHLKKKSVSEEF